MCLADEALSSHLTDSPSSIRAAIEGSGLGMDKQLSKDFLLPSSKDTEIVRYRENSKSRKCTTVYLELLPAELQEHLKQGKLLLYESSM